MIEKRNTPGWLLMTVAYVVFGILLYVVQSQVLDLRRELAKLTQTEAGDKMKRPQSSITNPPKVVLDPANGGTGVQTEYLLSDCVVNSSSTFGPAGTEGENFDVSFICRNGRVGIQGRTADLLGLKWLLRK